MKLITKNHYLQFDRTLGAWLRQTRQKQELTLKGLEEKTGIDQGLLSRFETGRLGLLMMNFIPVFKGLGLSFDQLPNPLHRFDPAVTLARYQPRQNAELENQLVDAARQGTITRYDIGAYLRWLRDRRGISIRACGPYMATDSTVPYVRIFISTQQKGPSIHTTVGEVMTWDHNWQRGGVLFALTWHAFDNFNASGRKGDN